MEEQKKKVSVIDILFTIIDLVIFFVGLIVIKLSMDDHGFFDVMRAYLKHHYWDTDTRRMKCEITYEEDDI